jgi:hypothetical protein
MMIRLITQQDAFHKDYSDRSLYIDVCAHVSSALGLVVKDQQRILTFEMSEEKVYTAAK